MQRNKEPPKKGKKRSVRNAKSKGKAKKPRRWLMARSIRPKDIAGLIATLATTVASLYSSVMELKREWDARRVRNKNKTKTKPRKPKRKKIPKGSHNQKPKQKHETKTEPEKQQ
jgi:hypothetical protein